MLIAMMVENKKRSIPRFPYLYILLLIPSVFTAGYADLNEIIGHTSFNLSGPIVLCVACLYFYNRKIEKEQFEKMVYNIILPLISACAVVVLKIRTLATITFTTDSNKLLSGGFGPNQVSAIFGFGFAILFIAWLVRVKITKSHFLDLVVGLVFLGFALLSFSRGGVVTAIVSIVAAMFMLIVSGENVKAVKQIINLLLIFAVLGSATWVIIDNFSGGVLSLRYEKAINADPDNVNTGLINTTGRAEIANEDLKIFLNNPVFGVGPGMATSIRSEDLGQTWAAHTEFSRLLAEHGFFGIICVLTLIISPVLAFKNKTPEGKTIAIAMIVLSLSTMLHMAMRMAFVGVAFGLGFADYDFKNINPLIRSGDN